jgi:hypothetical protein
MGRFGRKRIGPLGGRDPVRDGACEKSGERRLAEAHPTFMQKVPTGHDGWELKLHGRLHLAICLVRFG